jgi:hypothetical protein
MRLPTNFLTEVAVEIGEIMDDEKDQFERQLSGDT